MSGTDGAWLFRVPEIAKSFTKSDDVHAAASPDRRTRRSTSRERQPLPERYVGLSDEEMDARIAAARATLGRRLVILGHHYQRDEVIKFADYTGDSYKLAQQVSKHPDAEFIVFCGVHFMAESADVLERRSSAGDPAGPRRRLLDGRHGRARAARDVLERSRSRWASSADRVVSRSPTSIRPPSIKAFCGERGGVVCTSSNAAATLRWAWERGERILFLPDQHLGRNTAYKMGVPLDEMVVWDPNEIWGGLEPDAVKRARIILWKGHCSVHTRFTVRQIENIRAQHPGIRVIVHPEVPWDVVQAADDSGSTEYIIKQVKTSPAGSVWAVGTEIHLVNRLAQRGQPERTVLSLDQFGCLCSTMFRVSPNHLLWILEGLVDGEVHNRIVVPADQKHWTKVALDRMLSIS